MKINKKKIGNFFGTLGKGILKEAVSYIPIVGDNLANTIENKIGTGVTVKDSKADQVVEIAGKVLIGGVVVAFIFGYLTMDDLKSVLRLIG